MKENKKLFQLKKSFCFLVHCERVRQWELFEVVVQFFFVGGHEPHDKYAGEQTHLVDKEATRRALDLVNRIDANLWQHVDEGDVDESTRCDAQDPDLHLLRIRQNHAAEEANETRERLNYTVLFMYTGVRLRMS